MELDEMKATWELMSDKLTKQKEENLQLLEIMKKQEYKSKLGKIGNSEYLGTIICYIAAAYLGVKLPEINDGLMQLFAVICILLLFALPIISLKSIRGLKSNIDLTSSHFEAVRNFTSKKIRFQKLQKLNVSLGLFLMLIILPVLTSIQGKSLDDIPNFWTIVFPIGVTFFIGFSYWVLRSYNKLLTQMEGTFKEFLSQNFDQ